MTDSLLLSRALAGAPLPEWSAISADMVLSQMPAEKQACAQKQLGGTPQGLICAIFPYYIGNTVGNLSLYARSVDYHSVLSQLLELACSSLRKAFPHHLFRGYADISLYPEVYAAACAGLGVIGDHHLLLHPEWGSFVFIGLIATTLKLAGGRIPGECIHCGRCASACPGNALQSTQLCRDRCISHLTQKKGNLTSDEQQLVRLGRMIWGCDICQLACPFNQKLAPQAISPFRQRLIHTLRLEDAADSGLFAAKYGDRAFAWRGSEPLLRNLRLLGD